MFQFAFTKDKDIFLSNISKTNKFMKFNSNTILSNLQPPLHFIQLCQ